MAEKNSVERVQTGVRMSAPVLKVLKALAEYKNMGLGDLIEGIVLHAFDNKTPFSKETLGVIAKLKTCKTVVWNGPMGAFEIQPFDTGTVAVAKAVAGLTRDGTLVSIGGGGDTVAALGAAGVEDAFTYISTAGGAFLEWMEGKVLPGVVPLMQ